MSHAPGLSLVIDTDTASDDAIALLIAVRTPGVTVKAVTVVAGNVPLPLAVRNAIVTLDLVGGAHVPVHAGLAGPLLRPLETAQYVHGDDGMGGATLPDPSRVADAEHAVDVIRRIAHDEPGRHTLVTLGPLSNVATALLIEPDLLSRFRHTYLMAGAFDGVGNVHPLGEFNVWADPEAAAIVVDAPGDKTFIGWDISRRYSVMTPDDQSRLAALAPLGQFAVDINAKVNEYVAEHGLAGFDLPDPIAMAVAIDPTIMTKSQAALISIGTDPVSRGGTIVDHRFERGAPNARIAVVVDESRFKAMLFAACAD
ncbi:MAG: Nucleoside hydrolase [Acidimicrobiales bacterium]|nr:Nucleoside hydrolase [Acidimicrobiales bacterium]